MTFYILEPQKNMAAHNRTYRGRLIDDDVETCFRPCEEAEAEVYAVFSRETYNEDEDAIYLGDVSPEKARKLIGAAK